MIPVGNNDTGMICLNRDDHRPGVRKGIDIPPVHHGSYFQETEQYLVLSLKDDMIRSSDSRQLEN